MWVRRVGRSAGGWSVVIGRAVWHHANARQRDDGNPVRPAGRADSGGSGGEPQVGDAAIA